MAADLLLIKLIIFCIIYCSSEERVNYLSISRGGNTSPFVPSFFYLCSGYDFVLHALTFKSAIKLLNVKEADKVLRSTLTAVLDLLK